MPNSRKILVIDDDEDVLIAASLLLKKRFGQVSTLREPEEAYALLSKESFDVLLLDMNFSSDTTSGNEGLRHLQKIHERFPALPVILITAYGSIELAVRGLKLGAFDFILKPWKNDKLLETVSSALKLRPSESQAPISSDAPAELIGESEGMKEVLAILKKAAVADAPVLIIGEQGSGRRTVARELHRRSPAAAKPFVSMDLSAETELPFEQALISNLEAAGEGVLFMEEVNRLSLPSQSILLRLLQEMSYQPAGQSRSRPVKARLVFASGVNLLSLVKEGKFRQDLLFRIGTIEMHLPSLRYRGHDVYLLADHFLRQFSRKHKKSIGPLSAELKHALKHYPWPGNVRELQQRMERAVILCEGDELTESAFQFPEAEEPFLNNQATSMRIAELEREAIVRVMKKNSGNITHAAKELGLSRAALYRRIEKYEL